MSAKSIIFFLSLLTLKTASLWAQQESFQALAPFFPSVVNPAMAGQYQDLQLKAMYRRKPLLRNFGSRVDQQFLAMDIPVQPGKWDAGWGWYMSNLNAAFGYVNGGISSNFSLGTSFSKKFSFPNDLHVSGGFNYSINQFPFISSKGKSLVKSSLGFGTNIQYKFLVLAWARPSQLLNQQINSGITPYTFTKLGITFPENAFGHFQLALIRVKKYSLDPKIDVFLDYDWNKTWGGGLYYMNSGSDVFIRSIQGTLRYSLNAKLRLGYAFDLGSLDSIPFQFSGQTTGNTSSGFHQFYLLLGSF